MKTLTIVVTVALALAACGDDDEMASPAMAPDAPMSGEGAAGGSASEPDDAWPDAALRCTFTDSTPGSGEDCTFTDCGDGLVCTHYLRCATECTSDDDCDDGFTCANWWCLSVECERREPTFGFQTLGACQTNSDCPPPGYCDAPQCVVDADDLL